jgi:uncharacterized protein
MLLLTACRTLQPAATTPSATHATPATLAHLPAIDGDYFRWESRAVGRAFHVYVRLPEDYASAPDKRYPVVYVLDGDSLFPILAASHLFLAIDDAAIPECIVVGIAYGGFDPSVNRRGFDFTAPAARTADREQGGAPAFHAFLASELIPEVEQRYRADPARRVLFGQSRGGSFVLYSAFTDPDLFWGRIASNPSFDPGRTMFFSSPATAKRDDLQLIVTSRERDRPASRRAALAWFAHWRGRARIPWTLTTATVAEGTHAAYAIDSYRIGIHRLFAPEGEATPSKDR